jgi:hypothetical protein
VLGSRGEVQLAATADAIAASGGQVACQRTDVTQPQAGYAVVRSQTPKFWPLFHSTGELITTAPAVVPVVVSVT